MTISLRCSERKSPGVTSRCGAFGIALLFYNKLFTVADVNALR